MSQNYNRILCHLEKIELLAQDSIAILSNLEVLNLPDQEIISLIELIRKEKKLLDKIENQWIALNAKEKETMNNDEQKTPGQYDAVLGNQSILYNNALTDEIKALKLLLINGTIDEKKEVLHKALKHDSLGIQLIWSILKTESEDEVFKLAHELIKMQLDMIVKERGQHIYLPHKWYQFETVTVNKWGEVLKKESKQAQYYSENLGDGINLDMVYIPGGTFMMGSPKWEARSDKSQLPILLYIGEISKEQIGLDNRKSQRLVEVPSFYIAKYPITQAQWKIIANPPRVERLLPPEPSNFKKELNLPVESVTWDEATEFCARLSRLTGRQYRLPRTTEWEYACRAGTNTPYYFGETITGDLANYNASDKTYAEEEKGKYRKKTTPVGQFPPNSFGLYDMHGNVWEWCAKSQIADYSSPVRGGSWNEFADNCRSSYCYEQRESSNTIGFRVVCVIGN